MISKAVIFHNFSNGYTFESLSGFLDEGLIEKGVE